MFGCLGIIVRVIIMAGALGQGNMRGPEAVGAVVGIVAGPCGGFVGLIYPALAIDFMTRPHVKEYLQRMG